MEVAPYISSEDEILVSPFLDNKILSIYKKNGNQLDRIEKNISEQIPDKEKISHPFSLKTFKKESNEKEKGKEIKKIDLKLKIPIPCFKLSKNDPNFYNNLMEKVKEIKGKRKNFHKK